MSITTRFVRWLAQRTGHIVVPAGSLDQMFEAGRRAGYREGRRSALVSLQE